jgi:tetratricopeptide (TPR) repeat protein
MSTSGKWTVPIVFLVLLALGAMQGRQVHGLREAKAFYKWILAAGTSERLFSDEASELEDYQDRQLFEAVDAKTDGDLAALAMGGAEEQLAQDYILWEYTRSAALAPERAQFLALVRDDKLMFAQGLNLAQAQASGVNLFNLFVGFRKVAANFLWLQVDKFWHKGMMFRMIPLMRTCVALDPQFIDAYLLGAWHLAYNATAGMGDTPPAQKVWNPVHKICVGEKEGYYYEAVDFLRDGIRNNPRNYKLYFELGYSVYKNKLEDYANSVKYLQEAIRHPHERWVPRQLFISYELNDQYELALAGWEEYAQEFPENEVAQRFILRNKALILERDAEELQASGDVAGAEEKLARARELYQQMMDPYADARIKILEAKAYARDGRYYEAIGLLENARMESGSLFNEASDLIIEYKQTGGIPLALTERKALLRDQENVPCQGQPADVTEQI